MLLSISMETEVEKAVVPLGGVEKEEFFDTDELAKDCVRGLVEDWKTKAKEQKITLLRFKYAVFRVGTDAPILQAEETTELPN